MSWPHGGAIVSVPGRRLPSGLRGPAGELRGRRRECDALDRLLDGVRGGESRALVVRGGPGVGKTALLDYLAEHASGCRVVRVAGVESEMELAFAGVHQLIRQPGPVTERTFQVTFLDPDVQAYAFTFG